MLEGYVYLGNVNSLGEEVMAAFAEVMGAAALKVAALAGCQLAPSLRLLALHLPPQQFLCVASICYCHL